MFGLRTLLNPEIARNPALLTAAHALRAALFPIPVITVFWQEQIGMSLADIMWLQAIFAATIVILEFPSGYIADRLGYRLSLCLGAAFWLAGWTIYALGTLWLAVVSLMSARAGEKFGISRTLLICCALAFVGYLGLGLSASAEGVIFYLGFMTVRGLQGPLLASVMQKDAPPGDRASMLSLNALLFRLAAAVFLPPIGVLADRWGLDYVLAVMSVIAGVASLAAWRSFATAHKNP